MLNATAYRAISFKRQLESGISQEVGGQVQKFTAGGTLLVGDAVYISTAGTVNKSTTATNYVGFVGFVVGGEEIGLDAPVGTTAATSGQDVFVQVNGIARGIAGATITAGTNFSVMPSSSVAGRVITATGTGSINHLGTVITNGTTAGEVLVLINHRAVYNP